MRPHTERAAAPSRVTLSRWRVALIAVTLTAGVLASGSASAASALPDNRVWEMVTPVDTNGAAPGSAVAARSGNAVMFEAKAFGDAAAGGLTLYRAERTPAGWQTTALTPRNVVRPALLAETAPMFFTPELTQEIFTTAQPFAAGDQDGGALDLYEEDAEGALSWLSQGSQGATADAQVTYDGATPDGSHVVFDTTEALVPAATGLLATGYRSAEYLYARDVQRGQTELVDVNDSGALVSSEGAVLGNGAFMAASDTSFLPSDYDSGSTTHAISEDGSKIFFESPPPGRYEFPLAANKGHAVHLYMRKDGSATVALDDPEADDGSGARYMGAAANGSDVFFVSEEGLAGDPFKDEELYLYNTEAETLTTISAGAAGGPPIDGSVDGVTAIANDGSRVYYVAKGKLATNANAEGQSASEGQPNLYVYDTTSAENRFVTQLGQPEAEPEPGATGRLDSYLDISRLAVPTPNGEVLVFVSELDLTGQDPNGTLEVYRYDNESEALTCVSCDPSGAGGATLAIGGEGDGAIGGGSYDPPSQSAPMSENGDEIFFESENSLVPEDENGEAPPSVADLNEAKFELPNDIDVYEWENGRVYLISGGRSGATSLQSVSPSGSDVFFDTNVELVGQPYSGFTSLYDARVGGRPPARANFGSEVQPHCESPETCRGAPDVPPQFPLPASSIPAAAGGSALASSTVLGSNPKKQKRRVNKSKRTKRAKKTKRSRRDGCGKDGHCLKLPLAR